MSAAQTGTIFWPCNLWKTRTGSGIFLRALDNQLPAHFGSSLRCLRFPTSGVWGWPTRQTHRHTRTRQEALPQEALICLTRLNKKKKKIQQIPNYFNFPAQNKIPPGEMCIPRSYDGTCSVAAHSLRACVCGHVCLFAGMLCSCNPAAIKVQG